MYKYQGQSMVEGGREVVSNTRPVHPNPSLDIKNVSTAPSIKAQERADLCCGNDTYFYPPVPAPDPRASRPQFQTNLKLGPAAPAPTSHLLVSSSITRSLACPLASCAGSGSRRTHISSCNVRRRGSDPCPRSTPVSSWRQDSGRHSPTDRTTLLCTRKRAPCPESGTCGFHYYQDPDNFTYDVSVTSRAPSRPLRTNNGA